MKMTGAQALIGALEEEQVTTIFGYPGAANAPIYDALSNSSIKHILTRHEQGAAHASNGYARVTGKVGVCMATSGPGATNLITGIATAYMDSIPIIAITGQVSSEMIGRDVFQEVDITGATEPFCKHNYLVKSAEDIGRIIKEAFYIASTGRPGPVLIDIPMDIQLKEIDFLYPKDIKIKGYKPTYTGNGLQIKKITHEIEISERPVICAGGGVISANASDELMALSEHYGIPITTTLMGIGAVPGDHPLYLGMLGSHGVHPANQAVAQSDLLIIIGARAADRATGQTDKFAQHAKIVHIDIDPAEIGKNLGTNIPVVGDVRTVLRQLIEYTQEHKQGSAYKQEWVTRSSDWKSAMKKRQRKQHTDETGYVSPRYVLSLLSELTKENAVIITEVGQNQIWTANHYVVTKPRHFLTSGGLGTMGYGLPAAIGAKVGNPENTVILIAGDGSFQMSLQELGTMKQWGIDLKILLFNNNRLGMVREVQKLKYESNYFSVTLEGSPDFIKLAAAYGIEGEKITQNSKIEEALKKALEWEGSYLLEFMIDPEENTLP
ncbi:MAG: biosynthetic-type acetolactate synthase large subunit [Eubacteriales bacterium]|nr:biosynthetic-type acetolactate synthase large subunit [Eubacteriales bacterium]